MLTLPKKSIALIVGCSLISLTTVAFLFIRSEDLTHKMNSFRRIFPPHAFSEQRTIPIESAPYYIAGLTRHTAYLGSYTSPFKLLTINLQSGDVKDERLALARDSIIYRFKQFRVYLDSPTFYITDGVIPAIFKGDINSKVAKRYMYDSVSFSKIVPVSETSFVFRNISAEKGESVLGKLKARSPHVDVRDSILKKQIDGQFCVDGIINYDDAAHRVVYLYYYRNQFVVMDTSLNVIYTGKTIDTVSQAKLKVVKTSKGLTDLGAPPLRVNKVGHTANGLLFVNSNLMGKNEKKEVFDQHAPLDIYDLENGTYRFSLYLENSKLQDFGVVDNKLVALFDSQLKVFKLRDKYFKDEQ